MQMNLKTWVTKTKIIVLIGDPPAACFAHQPSVLAPPFAPTRTLVLIYIATFLITATAVFKNFDPNLLVHDRRNFLVMTMARTLRQTITKVTSYATFGIVFFSRK